MQLLGITLKTPDFSSLTTTAFVGLVIAAIGTALIAAGVASIENGVAIATGVIGGALARAYGVSVKDSGWRGAVLTAVFSLGLMVLVRILMAAI